MSWFKDGLKDVWDAFLGRDIGNTTSGFGGSGSNRSNTIDQLNLPNSALADDPEEIRLNTVSVSDTRDPNASIPVIYGNNDIFENTLASGRETGPQLVYISTSGTNNEYLHLTWWLCHGKIQGLDAFDNNFDNQSYDNRDPETGRVFSWRFNAASYYIQTVYDNYAMMFVHSGDWNNQARPTDHPDINFYPGIAHIKMTLILPDSSVQDPPYTNLPQLVWFVYGINPEAELIGLNPSSNTKNRRALYLWDYLTNKIYGAGISKSDLDVGSFIDSYNIESTSINGFFADGQFYTPNNPEPIHNVLYLSADKTVGENISQQLAEMQSVLTFKRGKYYLKPNDNLLVSSTNWSSGGFRYPSISRFILTVDNCIGGITYTPAPSEQKANRYNWRITSHRRFLGNVDGNNYFYDRDRNVEYEVETQDPRASIFQNPVFSYSGTPSTADALGSADSHRLKCSISFKATGEFLNADPYDIVRIAHPSYRSLEWFEFIITDVRLNSDMSVDIQATGSQRYDSGSRSTTDGVFRQIEADSDQLLRKYIYDYPEGFDSMYQFHNQEITPYQYNRYRDTYVPGVNINPETGTTVQEGEVLSVTALAPQSAIHPYYIHTITDTVISQRFKVDVSQISSGQHNLYIRAYTQDPVTGELTPVQRGSSSDRFVSVPSSTRMPEITTYQGTGLQPQSGNQTYQFTLTLLENTLYTIRVESYNNTTGELVNTIDLESFTTYADASALPVNLFSYRAGTLESAYSGTFNYPGGNLSSVLADCLGGTVTVHYDLYWDKTGSYPRSFTVDIPSTSVADALAKTFFHEYDNRDWIDIDPRPNYDIRETLEFRDSGGTVIYYQPTFAPFTWLFWGNTKLERDAGFSFGNQYTLTEPLQQALVDAGRTDLLW